MKKFFFALCALIVGMAANAQEYYLVGNFNGWKMSDEKAHFALAEDGTYVLDYEGTLTSGFKINNGSWDKGVNYGTNGSNLVVGKAYEMKPQIDGGDIAVESSIANPHCVLDVNKWILTITTTSGPVESIISYAIHGDVFTGKWESSKMDAAEDGTWTLTATLQAGEFGIQKLDNGSQVAWIAADGATNVSANTPMSAKVSGSNWSSTLAGEYTFVFDPEAMTLTIKGETPVGPDPVDPVYTYAVHGSVFTGGNWESRAMKEAEDGTWTLTATLQSGKFGIKKLDEKGNQVAWISAANGLTEAVVNIAMGASTSGSDWESALAGEYTFVFNPTAMTLTIQSKTVDPDPVDPVLPEHVYIVGNLEAGMWNPATAPELTFAEDTKLFSIENIEIKASSAESTTGYFSFITVRGSDWDKEVNISDRYGAPEKDALLTVPSTTNVTLFKACENASAAYSWKVEAGFYDIVLNLVNMSIYITTNVSSAADIELGNEDAPVYFNLQGVQVAEPTAGLYIEVRGNQVRKVMIK